MKDAINKVGDKMGLPTGWMNADFQKTSSYSPKLVEYSKYYKTFSNIVTVRTVSEEYLVAMKLKSGRQYKNELSDIVGIIKEEKENNKPLTYEKIDKAVINLYGSWNGINEKTREDLICLLNTDDLGALYKEYRLREHENKEELLAFKEKNPGSVDRTNLSQILEVAKRKKGDFQLLRKETKEGINENKAGKLEKKSKSDRDYR